MEEHVSPDMLHVEERPSKKSKKGGAKGSVALLKESTHNWVVKRESGDQNTPSNSPRAPGTK